MFIVLYFMKRLLIANRGLSAIKFILSIRDVYNSSQVHLVGIATSNDIISDYRYISELDEIIYANKDIYTDIEAIVSLCKKHKIDAVFPGWGYLSERSDFVFRLEESGIIFMGPGSKTIDSLGNKINSMKVAEENNVPLSRWSGITPLKSCEEVLDAVRNVGVPCVLKDADGGGGKGIRIIETFDEMYIRSMYHQIQTEMKRNPNESVIFVMELMNECHHIEIQLVGDGETAIHLYGRDCTCQRRNQKLVEEGPITVAPRHIIEQCERSAVSMAKAVGYVGLGTAEFLYIPETKQVTFLEINPRLQVEHVVTELLFNINLPVILYQITVEHKSVFELFAGLNYNISNKHVIAVRVNAEQPEEDFKPSCGSVHSLEIPNVPQCWSYVSIHNGGKILDCVDSQFGHLFTVGNSREEARLRMVRLIQQIIIDSDFHNSLNFVRNVLLHNKFIENRHTTQWIKGNMFNRKHSMAGISLIEDMNWIIGLIVQGWCRWKATHEQTTKLLQNGHCVIPSFHVDANVGVKVGMYTVTTSGTLYVNGHNSIDGITWYNLCLELLCNSKCVLCELCVLSKSTYVLKIKDHMCRIQVQAANDDMSSFHINVCGLLY